MQAIGLFFCEINLILHSRTMSSVLIVYSFVRPWLEVRRFYSYFKYVQTYLLKLVLYILRNFGQTSLESFGVCGVFGSGTVSC